MVRMLSPFRTHGGLTRVIVHQETHPKYNAELKLYDFQLLKLDQSALVTAPGNNATGAKVVPLNEDYYQPPVGSEVTAVGFGTVTPDGSSGNSDFLMDVQIKRFDHLKCEEQYGHARIPDNVMFCMGVEGGGKDVCQGEFWITRLDAQL